MSGKLRVLIKKNIWIIIILAMAFFLRCWHLADIPINLGGDEFTQALAARAFLEGKRGSPFSTGWYSVPTLYFFLGSFFLKFLGNGVFAWRFFSVLAGTLTVFMLYLFGKEYFTKKTGLIAAALLAFFHAHLFFSRIGSNQIFDGLFHLLVYYFLLLGIKKGKYIYFVLSGAFLGLSQYFYFGTRIIPIISLLIFIAWIIESLLKKQRLKMPLLFLLIYFFSAFLVFLPLFIHYTNNPENYLSRVNQVNLFETFPQQKWQRIKEYSQYTISFFWNKGAKGWYATSFPFVDKISLFFLIIGAFSLLAMKGLKKITLTLWFFLTLLVGSILTVEPACAQRLTGIFPTVCLIIAIGIEKMSIVIKKFGIFLIILIIAAINLRQLFGSYLPDRYDPNTAVATEIAYYFKENNISHAYLLTNRVGVPRMWAGSFSNTPFLSPQTKYEDFVFSPSVGVDCQASFILLPENLAETKQILSACPQDNLKRVVYVNPKSPGIQQKRNLLTMYFSKKGSRNFVLTEYSNKLWKEQALFYVIDGISPKPQKDRSKLFPWYQ